MSLCFFRLQKIRVMFFELFTVSLPKIKCTQDLQCESVNLDLSTGPILLQIVSYNRMSQMYMVSILSKNVSKDARKPRTVYGFLLVHLSYTSNNFHIEIIYVYWNSITLALVVATVVKVATKINASTLGIVTRMYNFAHRMRFVVMLLVPPHNDWTNWYSSVSSSFVSRDYVLFIPFSWWKFSMDKIQNFMSLPCLFNYFRIPP